MISPTARRFAEPLADLEKQARAAKRGLWAGPSPIPPWEYRAEEARKARVRKSRKEGGSSVSDTRGALLIHFSSGPGEILSSLSVLATSVVASTLSS